MTHLKDLLALAKAVRLLWIVWGEYDYLTLVMENEKTMHSECDNLELKP